MIVPRFTTDLFQHPVVCHMFANKTCDFVTYLLYSTFSLLHRYSPPAGISSGILDELIIILPFGHFGMTVVANIVVFIWFRIRSFFRLRRRGIFLTVFAFVTHLLIGIMNSMRTAVFIMVCMVCRTIDGSHNEIGMFTQKGFQKISNALYAFCYGFG